MEIENLKALVYGRELSFYQEGLAIQEFEKMREKLEALDLHKCDNCNYTPGTLYITPEGRFCERCKPTTYLKFV